MALAKARWVTDKYILVMLGVFPLFWGFEGYNNITASKFWFFVAVTGLWIVSVGVLLILAALRRERMGFTLRPVHAAFSLFLTAGAVSAMLSPYGTVCLLGASRFDGYLTTVLYTAAFFGVSLLAVPKPRYVRAMGISVFLCCVVAVLQLAGLDPFSLYPEGTNYYDKYIAYNSAFLGTIGNTGLLSAYLCLGAPLLVIFGLLSGRTVDRLLLLPGALALGVLVLCDVDAGLVALAGCLLVSVPMVMRTKKASDIAAGVSGGVTALGLGTLYFWQGDSGLLYELSQVLHGNLSDEFGSRRGQIWKQCWELFRERPWFGGGPGTAAKRLHIIWSNEIRSVSVQNAHNVYFGYLINMGVFALASYLAAFACSLVTWFRRRRSGAIYPALGSAFLCYMIQDFFGLGLTITEPMLWIVWALLESAGEIGE